MENGTKTELLELQKQNRLLQFAVQISEEKARQSDEKNKRLEEQKEQLSEQNKYLQFQLDQIKRMLFGAKRERFISNADVNQMTLPFDLPEEPATEPFVEKIEYSLDNKDKMKKFGMNARNTVVTNYALKDKLPKQIEFLNSLVKK